MGTAARRPLEALLRLNLSGMVGSALLRAIEAQAGLAKVDRLGEAELRRVPGIGPITARAIRQAPDPREELALAAKHGVEILALDDPRYPAALKSLYDHPIVLYRRGAPAEADLQSIGVVGSRECTDYGRRQAARFGRELASMGVPVVSGLARGIDTAAHRGALEARDGRTIAVLGCGLLRPYPPENAALLEEICRRGAAYSEFPLRTPPEGVNFPRRNRIIAGLCLGVLVAEAGETSGALLTADWAVEQGREVFCLPGSVENPLSRGCHRLIRQGAKLVETPADILEEFPAFASLVQAPLPLSPLERSVLRGRAKCSTPEGIAAETRLPLSAVERALASLGAKGLS